MKEPNSAQAKAFYSIARNMAAQISIRNMEKQNAPIIDIQLGTN